MKVDWIILWHVELDCSVIAKNNRVETINRGAGAE